MCGGPSVLLYSVKFARMGSLVPPICILNPGEARRRLRVSAAARGGQVDPGESEQHSAAIRHLAHL